MADPRLGQYFDHASILDERVAPAANKHVFSQMSSLSELILTMRESEFESFPGSQESSLF